MGATTSTRKNTQAAAKPEISPWATSFAAAAILAAGGAIGDAAHIPVLVAGVITVPGMLATLMVSIHRKKLDAAATLYRLGCWVAPGSWMAAILIGPHNWQSIWSWATLGGGAVAAALLAPFGHCDDKTDSAQAGAAVTLYKGGRRGQEWADRIYRVCNKLRVEVSDIVDWPTKTGYNVHALLPIGGSTVDDIKRATKSLATDARLPRGCALRVVEGNLQGEVVISVPTVNRLVADIPFVADHTPSSILKPQNLGEYQDGRPVEVALRQASTLLVGMKGSGKTTLLDLLTYRLGHCVDALVWHIDLNGGGMSWAWMQPWINGQTDRPPIDLTAITPEDALIMVKLAYAIGLDRKGSYNHLKIQANTRLMPLSRSLPAVHIVVDEGKKVLATTERGIIGQIRDMLIKIQDELRDAGITVDASSLRATQTAIDPDFKVQVGNKIAMHTQTDAEIAYLLDWPANLKADDLPPYCGYIQFDQDEPDMFKAPEILPSDIAEGAVHIAGMRPELDAAGQKLGGDWYATRYTRMRETFARALDADGQPQPTTSNVPVLEGVVTPMFNRTAAGPVQPPAGPSDWEDPMARFNQPAGGRPSDWADPLARFNQQPPARPSNPVQTVPPLIVQALAGFDAAGAKRFHSEPLVQALGFASAHEMSRLLVQLDVRPLAEAFYIGGQRARGYSREAFAEAAERIAAGDLAVPDEVAEWNAA
jgi:S-DNA-T family DNA segregation ATPase FtsK/SpoIIIE